MRVLFPERIVDRHVGGNTTYARRLVAGVEAAGHATGRMPAGGHPAVTAALETAVGLRRRRGTVLHHSADTGPLLRGRTPSVVTVHGVASRWTNVARSPLQERVWRGRVRRAIRSTDALITVSESSADDVAAVFDVDRDAISVIPHGVDHDVFASPVPLEGRLRVLAERPYALYLGNIEPRKNLLALVEAFESAAVRSSGVQLVLAGRPAWDCDDVLERVARSRNSVHLGFVDDRERAALLQHTELFLFPSLYEGFGFPVLEALAAGVPVAASRRGSLAEVAGPSWHLEDLGAGGIADAVTAALSDDAWRRRVRDEGPRWAARFSWDTSVRAHLNVYAEVLQ